MLRDASRRVGALAELAAVNKWSKDALEVKAKEVKSDDATRTVGYVSKLL